MAILTLTLTGINCIPKKFFYKIHFNNFSLKNVSFNQYWPKTVRLVNFVYYFYVLPYNVCDYLRRALSLFIVLINGSRNNKNS